MSSIVYVFPLECVRGNMVALSKIKWFSNVRVLIIESRVKVQVVCLQGTSNQLYGCRLNSELGGFNFSWFEDYLRHHCSNQVFFIVETHLTTCVSASSMHYTFTIMADCCGQKEDQLRFKATIILSITLMSSNSSYPRRFNNNSNIIFNFHNTTYSYMLQYTIYLQWFFLSTHIHHVRIYLTHIHTNTLTIEDKCSEIDTK